ncbi:MAG TPA: hypothetical protein VGE34_03700 [Candidatus Saccharimonadales bacterium]
MQAKIDVIRALTSTIAKRALLIISIAGAAASLLLLIGIWALAHYLSAWWWLLLFIYIPWLLIALVILGVAKLITHKIYPYPLNTRQKRLLKDFADKIQHLLESRGMGWWMFAFLCFKDLLFYRDLRTLKELIRSTASLKQDFADLERSFGE